MDGGNSTVVGPAGGTVVGDDGARVIVPAGALSNDVEISVSASSSGFQPLPALAGGGVYALEPHGLEFALPVTVILPHTLNDGEVAMWTSSPGGGWERLATLDRGGETSVEVTHFSFFFNGREVCGLFRQECCDSAEPDGQCSGDALYCDGDNRCMGCGYSSDLCCGGSQCYGPTVACEAPATGSGAMVCRDGRCGRDCAAIFVPPPGP